MGSGRGVSPRVRAIDVLRCLVAVAFHRRADREQALELHAPPPRARVAALEHDARTMLGTGSDFTVMIVDDIPLEPSGKFQVCRSLVAPARPLDADARP
jgi:hypothetical protein